MGVADEFKSLKGHSRKTMKRIAFKIQVLMLVVLVSTFPLISASGTTAVAGDKFSDAELDELLAPIALYPDPLLAQIVPASTFIDQLENAQQVLGGSTDDNKIGNENWDVSDLNRANNTTRTNTDRPRLGTGGSGQQRTIGSGTRNVGGGRRVGGRHRGRGTSAKPQ